jgi:hypothetical protein
MNRRDAEGAEDTEKGGGFFNFFFFSAFSAPSASLRFSPVSMKGLR